MYVHMWWLKNVHFISNGNYLIQLHKLFQDYYFFFFFGYIYYYFLTPKRIHWFSKIAHVHIVAISIAIMFNCTKSCLLKVILLWKTHLFSYWSFISVLGPVSSFRCKYLEQVNWTWSAVKMMQLKVLILSCQHRCHFVHALFPTFYILFCILLS